MKGLISPPSLENHGQDASQESHETHESCASYREIENQFNDDNASETIVKVRATSIL